MNKNLQIPKSPNPQIGFTLAELLTVITIIGILLAALVPGIQTAIEMSRAIACKSNLRQMIVAAHAYASDHDDELPPAIVKDTTWEDILWSYDTRATDSKMFQCPSFKNGKANWAKDGRADRYTGYNYNASYLGVDLNTFPPPRPAQIGDIKDPGRCAVFGDGEYEGGANKFMRSPLDETVTKTQLDNGIGSGTRVAGTQGFRHRRSTHVAFADGSVRSLKERFTTTAKSSARGGGGSDSFGKNCGFLSADNSLYNLE